MKNIDFCGIKDLNKMIYEYLWDDNEPIIMG